MCAWSVSFLLWQRDTCPSLYNCYRNTSTRSKNQSCFLSHKLPPSGGVAVEWVRRATPSAAQAGCWSTWPTFPSDRLDCVPALLFLKDGSGYTKNSLSHFAPRFLFFWFEKMGSMLFMPTINNSNVVVAVVHTYWVLGLVLSPFACIKSITCNYSPLR